jgi:hypothetical protein
MTNFLRAQVVKNAGETRGAKSRAASSGNPAQSRSVEAGEGIIPLAKR